jgi:hypothetical protein
MTYPDTWPKFNPRKPWALSSRITDQEKSDLYESKITAKQLAIKYGTHEKYVAAMFPGRLRVEKPPKLSKLEQPLAIAREEFRMAICVEVLKGKMTVIAASEVCSCSYNTMQRRLAIAKQRYPELVPEYNARLNSYRLNFNKKASNVQS